MRPDNRQMMLDIFAAANRPLDGYELQDLCAGKIKINSITATRSRLVKIGKLVEVASKNINGVSIRRWAIPQKNNSQPVAKISDRLSELERRVEKILKRLR